MPNPHDLGAAAALDALRRGALTAEALAADLLARIAALDGDLGAFEHVDPGAVLAAARAADATSPRPPLAGLPVAVKDIADTFDLPTERGSVAFRGRRPARDAECVARLRVAGAVVLGKTVTAELAFYRPGKTRNPHDPSRTPGGSSSGSAAAVASRLAPAAIGTQTAGSVIRPASFCGVVGWKPTFGLVPMNGVSPFAPSLDTIGLFVRDLDGLPPLLAALGAPLAPARRQGPPRIGLCRTEAWALAEPSTRRIVEDAARALAAAGARVDEVGLGPAFAGLSDAQRAVMAAEGARTLAPVRSAHEAVLSDVLRAFLDEGARVAPDREAAARAQADRCRALLAGVFADRDALLGASAIGEAPVGLGSTGDPAMNRIWTLLGTPCVSLPAARGPAGMPVGVQLVGAPGRDGALFDAARWAADALGVSAA